MASIDISKEVVNYRNRFLREVIFDLVVRFGKDGIMHILRDIKTDETPKEDVFVAVEDDGSEWVHLEDYNNLRMAFLMSDLALEKQIEINSDILNRQLPLEQTHVICSCGSPEFYNDKVFGVVCCRCQAPYPKV